MLRNLVIDNYALIEHLDLEFDRGLTIITGETGAGKSIILGALSLVMGGRADTKVISDGNSKSVVEALFTEIDEDLRPVFEKKGIDWICNEEGHPELIVRRELAATGRSRVMINDCSVTLQTLSQIVPKLIDIHSQHANARINLPAERLSIIDSMAGNDSIRLEYTELFNRYVALRREIKKLKDERLKASSELEFLKFRLDRLNVLKPVKGELSRIEKRFEVLSDADDIKEKVQLVLSLLGDGENGIQNKLGEVSSICSAINFNSLGLSNREVVANDESEEISDRVKSLISETRDIYDTIEDFYSGIDTDPALLSRLSGRMNLYYETMRQFGVSDADELVKIHSEIQEKVDSVSGDNSILISLEKEAKALASDLRTKAALLTESRQSAAVVFSNLVCEKARQLGLSNLRFQTEIRNVKLTSSGSDEVDFMCSFNKNAVERPLSDIASGGEISRLMLGIKSILAGHINLPTIIFDEIDTGVSGEIAHKMGEMMYEISRMMQVIVITHLPQVAAKGDFHLKVYKEDVEDKTLSKVKILEEEGRIQELASMISGSKISEEAISAARSLLYNN